MYYTQEQIDRANQADLVSFLQSQGEQLTRAGNEYRWKRHDSLNVRGNKWYRHSQSKGGAPIDFVMEFFGKSFRGRQALCAWVQGRQRTAGVKGQRPLGGYRAAAPVRSVEAASLYSGVQRWKTSAQGKLMPASTCTGYYLTQNS